MTPLAARVLDSIEADDAATARLFAWMESRGVQHTGALSAITLGRALAVDPRTWRRWYYGESPTCVRAMRLLCEGAGVPWPA